VTRLLLLALVALTGCAATAPLRAGVSDLDLDDGSVAFLTLRVSNTWKPAFVPELKLAVVTQVDEDGDLDTESFEVEPPYAASDPAYADYLISFQLDSGDWTLENVFGQKGVFPASGNFIIPLAAKFNLPERRVVYLGHIHANVIERTRDDELRAGPVVPPIDQAAAGASTGTFVIHVEDRFAEDVGLARREFGLPANEEVLDLALPTPH